VRRSWSGCTRSWSWRGPGRSKDIDNSVTPEVIQLAVAQKLPQVALAFQQRMGEVHVTAVDGANPFGDIAAAVGGVMGLARSVGLKPQGKAPASR
jgi:flotillin